MLRILRHLLKLLLGLATLYFALVWAGWLAGPSWLPAEVEPLTVMAGAVLFLFSWWEEILALPRPTTAKGPVRFQNHPQQHLATDAIDRKRVLWRLHRRLRRARRPVVVLGIGGLGKTTLVQLYCRRYQRTYTNLAYLNADAVFTGDPDHRTDNAEYFLRAFTDNQALLTALHLTLDPLEKPVEQFRRIVAALGQVRGRNLLVIDNAAEAAAIYLDELSRLSRWKILLTSRDAIQHTEHFALDVLPPAKAAALFRRIYAQPTTDGPALDALLAGIGYHTLTIELLAAYGREKRLSLAALREELQERGLRRLDEHHVTVTKSSKLQSLNAHLRDTFLLELSEAEKEILRYFSLLPPTGAAVNPSLLTEEKLCDYFGKNDTPTDFHNLLHNLVKLHWVTERNGSYACHPVIRETAHDQLRPDAENCAVLIKNFTGWLVSDEERHETMLSKMAFGPIGEAILRGVLRPEEEFGEADGVVARLALWLGQLFREIGQLHLALEYDQIMVAIREKILSPEHPDLATSYNNLATTYGSMGDHQKRLEYNQKALAIWEKILPPDHPNLAISYNNLAETYRGLDEAQKALEHNKKALAIREKILPPDHPDLATSYNNLALTYRSVGKRQKELSFHQKALTIWEKNLPPQHPDLARSYNNLAATYGSLGDHQKELEYDLKALAIREKILPPQHPNMALSYNNIAITYYHLGHLPTAIAYMEKAVAIREQALPPEHPYVQQSRENLAFLRRRLEEK